MKKLKAKKRPRRQLEKEEEIDEDEVASVGAEEGGDASTVPPTTTAQPDPTDAPSADAGADPEALIKSLGDNIDRRYGGTREGTRGEVDDADEVWSEFELEADEEAREDRPAGVRSELVAARAPWSFAETITAFRAQRRLHFRRTTFYGHNRHTVTCLAVSPARTLYFGDKRGQVVAVDLHSRQRSLLTPRHRSAVLSLAASGTASTAAIGDRVRSTVDAEATKSFVVAGFADGAILTWNATTREFVGVLREHRAAVTGLCFRQRTHTLYSASLDSIVRVWSIADQIPIDKLHGHVGQIFALSCLTKSRCATIGADRTMRFWNTERGTQSEYESNIVPYASVCLLDEETVVCGGDDGTLSVFDVARRTPLLTYRFAHGYAEIGDGTGLELHARPQQATAAAEAHAPPERSPFLGNAISALAAVPNSDTFASGSCDGTVRAWKISETRAELECLGEVPVVGVVNGLAFLPGGSKLFAAVGKDGRLGRWIAFSEALNGVVEVPLISRRARQQPPPAAPTQPAKAIENEKDMVEKAVEEAFRPVTESKLDISMVRRKPKAHGRKGLRSGTGKHLPGPSSAKTVSRPARHQRKQCAS